MKRLIYADNAATTQLDNDAFEAMKPYLLNEYGNASQPYSFSRSPKAALKNAREVIAECINAEPCEIYFTSGGTESDNWAIKGSAFIDITKRATITSAFEHHAVLRACHSIERMGYPVVYLQPNTSGVVTPESLYLAITPNTRLVSVMMSNNELGTIQPIIDLARIAHEHNAYFHTDAVQCVGHMPIDVKKLDVDMLSASAHKFNGPKGIGFLYIKKGVSIEPLMDGGSQEGQLRAGTENIANIIGMSVALKKNCDTLQRNTEHLLHIEQYLIKYLDELGIHYVRNGKSDTLPGIISLSFPSFEGEKLMHRLDLMGIQVSTGSACDSVNTQISHVLEAIALDEDAAKGTIRISLGKNNTEEDVATIVESIHKILNIKKDS